MLTKQSCQRFGRWHSPPGKNGFLAAGEALTHEMREALFAVWIFAANRVRASAVETLEVVDVLMPTKWADQLEHLKSLKSFDARGRKITADDQGPQAVAIYDSCPLAVNATRRRSPLVQDR